MNGFSSSFCRFSFTSLLFLGSFAGLLLVERQSQCEDKVPIGKRIRTELSFVLVMPQGQSNPLAAQKWAKIFEGFSVPVHIRQRQFKDVAGVDQLIYGTIRRIKVTGQLDRKGSIRLPDKTFSLTDTEQLEQWIEELKIYGAQGTPEGQPLWGLKKSEFKLLHAELTKTVTQQTAQLSLSEAIRALELPAKYPLKFTTSARTHLAKLETQNKLPEMPHDLRKFSKGTAIAMVLRSYSLAFSPVRLPNESVELRIEPSSEIDTAWPIGWDPDSFNLKRLALARKMYISQMIEIQDLPLSKLIPKVHSETELDLFIDPLAISSTGLDLDKLIVNFPRKRSSWSLCLRTVLAQVKLTQQLRVDENNRPFTWITKFDPKGSHKTKF